MAPKSDPHRHFAPDRQQLFGYGDVGSMAQHLEPRTAPTVHYSQQFQAHEQHRGAGSGFASTSLPGTMTAPSDYGLFQSSETAGFQGPCRCYDSGLRFCTCRNVDAIVKAEPSEPQAARRQPQPPRQPQPQPNPRPLLAQHQGPAGAPMPSPSQPLVATTGTAFDLTDGALATASPAPPQSRLFVHLGPPSSEAASGATTESSQSQPYSLAYPSAFAASSGASQYASHAFSTGDQLGSVSPWTRVGLGPSSLSGIGLVSPASVGDVSQPSPSFGALAASPATTVDTSYDGRQNDGLREYGTPAQTPWSSDRRSSIAAFTGTSQTMAMDHRTMQSPGGPLGEAAARRGSVPIIRSSPYGLASIEMEGRGSSHPAEDVMAEQVLLSIPDLTPSVTAKSDGSSAPHTGGLASWNQTRPSATPTSSTFHVPSLVSSSHQSPGQKGIGSTLDASVLAAAGPATHADAPSLLFSSEPYSVPLTAGGPSRTGTHTFKLHLDSQRQRRRTVAQPDGSFTSSLVDYRYPPVDAGGPSPVGHGGGSGHDSFNLLASGLSGAYDLDLAGHRAPSSTSGAAAGTSTTTGQQAGFGSMMMAESSAMPSNASLRSAAAAAPAPSAGSRTSSSYATDEARWAAMLARSHAADRHFLYGALTTKIVCKPSCASKRPDRNRVRFFANPGAAAAAISAGYRPCKRCKPHVAGTSDQCVLAVGECVRHITQFAAVASVGGHGDVKRHTLKEYAAMARLSPFHFHRTFKAVSSVTPGEYAKACHTLALQDALGIDGHGRREGLDAASINLALSSWSVRRARRAVGGVSPSVYATGCSELSMFRTSVDTSFGQVAIAFTEPLSDSDKIASRVYATLLGDDAEERMRRRFPYANDRPDREAWLASIVEDLASASDREVQLPEDVHHSVRRARIWIAVTRSLAKVGSGSELGDDDDEDGPA
ncbi:uncharacterized protein PSFLO_06742 [Pseudozyma flocculosa]|nr:uncharacterized protein PSFLO_06742 [Pseudozyma flocculosa]